MKRTTMNTFVLLSGLAVSAIAQSYNDPNSYEEQKQTMSKKERDIALCRYEAARATASGPVGPIVDPVEDNVYSRMLVLEIRREELTRLCMEAKGYEPKVSPRVRQH
jgi:hypothetical protein